jgi:hypothetical protein
MSEPQVRHAVLVAEFVGRIVSEAERCGAPPSVVLELQRLHDVALDRVAHARDGWR